MPQTQIRAEQVKGLSEVYKKVDELNKSAEGIKTATFITAISTLVLAVVGIISLFK
jgi:hypothetical protein